MIKSDLSLQIQICSRSQCHRKHTWRRNKNKIENSTEHANVWMNKSIILRSYENKTNIATEPHITKHSKRQTNSWTNNTHILKRKQMPSQWPASKSKLRVRCSKELADPLDHQACWWLLPRLPGEGCQTKRQHTRNMIWNTNSYQARDCKVLRFRRARRCNVIVRNDTPHKLQNNTSDSASHSTQRCTSVLACKNRS